MPEQYSGPLTEVTTERSKKVRGVHYDPQSKTLFVQFNPEKNGVKPVYTYDGVQPEVHTALMGAESMGKFFNSQVMGKFPYKKIWPRPQAA